MAPGGQKESNKEERKLAVKLKHQGKTTKEIAKLIGRSERWVKFWKPGPTSFANKKGRGRKTKLTTSDKQQITALMKDKVGRALVNDYWVERVRKVFEHEGDNSFKDN